MVMCRKKQVNSRKFKNGELNIKSGGVINENKFFLFSGHLFGREFTRLFEWFSWLVPWLVKNQTKKWWTSPFKWLPYSISSLQSKENVVENVIEGNEENHMSHMIHMTLKKDTFHRFAALLFPENLQHTGVCERHQWWTQMNHFRRFLGRRSFHGVPFCVQGICRYQRAWQLNLNQNNYFDY